MILRIQTKGQTDIIDITSQIEKFVREKKLEAGVVNLFVKGSTVALTTIEADDNLYEDLREVLESITPMRKNWRDHQTWGDDNGSAHLRASIFGPSLAIPIINSKMMLGSWQKIVLLDFDTSPREREVIISFCQSIF